jgi:4-hydroxy-tetrahydrodipicolinate synthase
MTSREAPYGRVATAMVTPMYADGEIDYDGAAALAVHLIEHGTDTLVVSGTTGESPTTSREEKADLLRAVLDAVGDRAKVIAGAGTYDTAQSVELARDAEKVGAHGLLAVTPYYSKPPQDGLIAHFERIADATGLPVMLYDLPGRTSLAIETETLVRLAEHPRITALKDAKLDLGATSWVAARTDLAIYSGQDEYTLPLLAVGAVGVVSVVAHLAGERLQQMIGAFLRGDVDTAREVHLGLMPLFTGLFRVTNPVLTKAAVGLLGLPAGPPRLPLVTPTLAHLETLRADLEAGGVALTAAAGLGPRLAEARGVGVPAREGEH